MAGRDRARVTAVLGPTNTGKTYLAIERMLGYRSGMVGFPLRLLARENYDKVVRLKGARQVALVTGEEKIVPPGARYFLCTVESMPIDRRVDFLAVDEVQLCADPERGHVFTDRLLHARGDEETMFLGAETIRGVLRSLVGEADVISRPRFSTLSYSGPRKITRLQPRSAAIAFSAAQVYELAELLRRQRGGTAVVLGALSPRTRNAQVEMFESGEVDYLVATDAIGMGLNLSLDHVAFSRLVKFDGRGPRRLNPAEVAQIAGRAGRHMSDGSFGTTAELGPMDEELVARVEEHRFESLRAVYWRNSDLDFASPERLARSLERRPPAPELLPVRRAEDTEALAALRRDPEISATASHPAAVALLWEVCQIPDFEKTLSDRHAALLGRLYRYLTGPEERLPEDWVAGQIKRVDRTDGDIEALVGRIQQVRTWTYITHRGDWLSDAGHWQERARATEDRLSDALHDRLTQRFVDRRTAVLVRRLRDGERLLAAVRRNGEVIVEGELVGRLEGFRFKPDSEGDPDEARALLAAARRVLTDEIPSRIRTLESETDEAFKLDPEGRVAWHGAPVARLASGATALQPRIEVLRSEFLDGRQRERLRKRLALWLERHIRERLRPLFRLAEAELKGSARGLAFQLVEALGSLPRRRVSRQVGALSKAERRAFTDLGVRLGAGSLFLPALLRQRSIRLRALLWAVHNELRLPLPPSGPLIIERAGSEAAASTPEGFWLAAGYRLLRRDRTSVAIRADSLERLAREARRLAAQGPFAANTALLALAGGDQDTLGLLLAELGYRAKEEDGVTVFTPRRDSRPPKKPKRRARRPAADSPFAQLRKLKRPS